MFYVVFACPILKGKAARFSWQMEVTQAGFLELESTLGLPPRGCELLERLCTDPRISNRFFEHTSRESTVHGRLWASAVDVVGQACILQVQLLHRQALLEVIGRCVVLPWFAGAEPSRPCRIPSDYHSGWRQALHITSLDYFLWAKKQFAQDRALLLSSGMSDSFGTIPP